MTITISPLQPADIEQTIEVIKKSISISLGVIYPPQLIEAFCGKYKAETFAERMKIIDHFVAKTEDGTVVGVLGLQENNRLRSFYVDPTMQGKGIGRKLYDYVEAEAKKRGTTYMILEGSPLGVPVYEKFGFVKKGEVRKNRAGVPFVDAYMEKVLA
jgi:GNAT superfamily N-acetyltransferase